jgi:hypothetical protein
MMMTNFPSKENTEIVSSSLLSQGATELTESVMRMTRAGRGFEASRQRLTLHWPQRVGRHGYTRASRACVIGTAH